MRARYTQGVNSRHLSAIEQYRQIGNRQPGAAILSSIRGRLESRQQATNAALMTLADVYIDSAMAQPEYSDTYIGKARETLLDVIETVEDAEEQGYDRTFVTDAT